MTKTINGVDGVDGNVSDGAFAAQFPAETVNSVFARGVAALTESLNWAENQRQLTWTSPVPEWIIRDGAALSVLEGMAGWATRLQVGFTNFGTDTASFTGAIASGILTSSAQTGFLYPGVFISGTDVPGGAFIVGQLTGNPGQAGTYLTSIGGSVSSTAMTSAGYHEGLWEHGDGVGVYIELADGSPSVVAVNANNIMDCANAGGRYRRACRATWSSLYVDLVTASETVGTDANKIDAMRVVIDTFDDPAEWPVTSIS